MQYALNGWHEPYILHDVAERGWHRLRFGLPSNRDEADRWLTTTKDLIGPPLVIIRELSEMWDRPLLAGCDCEWQNEPNGTIDRQFTPESYAASVSNFVLTCHDAGAFPWIGSIGNTDKKSQEWLHDMLDHVPSGLPDYGITTHWYPHRSERLNPHPGFANRREEQASLMRIVGPRRWAVSEFGFHTARQRTLPWLPWWGCNTYRWSDRDVAEMVREEFDLLEAWGAEFAVLYQITDGPTDTKEDRFGIMRDDGTFKPVADAPTW